MPCPRCQHENPSGQKFCGACGTPLTANPSGPPAPSYAEITSTLSEAREQQTATAEILNVISSSPTDVQPVFAAVLMSAARLCDALDASIFQVDGDGLRLVAHEGPILSHPVGEFPLIRGMTVGRAVLDRRTIHVPDVQAEVDEYPDASSFARSFGFRTTLAVPLLRGREAIGAIGIRRTEVRPFTDRQIKLLETFAAQAVIAIENVRLFNETRETLEQQTASGEILRVIASSPTDLGPVMEAVAENAARVCGATDSAIFRLEGEHLRLMALHGPLRRSMTIGETIPVSRGTVGGRVVHDRRTIHVEDIMLAEAEFPETVSRMRQRGSLARTLLATPLLREGVPLGTIFINRGPDVQPFSAKQIALLETFANQAVIAIENVRLFTELQEKNRAVTEAHAQVTEALEQQTATAGILRVIASSPSDLQPVMEAIAANAARVCGATDSSIYRLEGKHLRLVTQHGSLRRSLRVGDTVPVDRDSVVGRAVADGRTLQVEDIRTAAAEFPVTAARAGQTQTSVRTMLATPLLREGTPLGVIFIARGPQPHPFSAKQIKLLETFADQAVIAIENVRLFKELQQKNQALTEAHAQVTESLEQQTATSEILRVIASSPTDLLPVMQVVVENAARVCGAMDSSIFRLEGEHLRLMARHGPLRISYAIGESAPVSPDTVGGRVIHDRRTIHVEDILAAEAEFPVTVSRGRAGGSTVRTMAATPLLREGIPVGVLYINRGPEPHPFSAAQIALLETFANQAVIAIENVRLFTELETRNRELTESLEQQTATGEILRVISTSPTDMQPVFDTMVRSATLLCGAMYGTAVRFDGELMHLVASYNHTPEVADALHQIFPTRPSPLTMSGRAILAGDVVQVEDALDDADYAEGVARAGGFGSMLAAPMVRDGHPIGAIVVNRGQPGPFSRTQIELLKTFASQAVIAVENVRLFTELEARNREVTETLEQQTATAEILRVIASSPTDLQPVMEAVAENAARVCGATDSTILRLEGEHLRLMALHGPLRRSMAIGEAIPVGCGTVGGRVVHDRRTIHVEDIMLAEAEFPETVSRMRQTGSLTRTMLGTPLLREGTPLGVIFIARGPQPHPFSAKQIDLLETFANQAVIAIENVRLFQELEEKNRSLTQAHAQVTESLEQQTATSEILRAISSSPTDVQPVLDAVASNAAHLCGATDAQVFRIDGESLRRVASHGAMPAWERIPINRESATGRAVADRGTIHVRDIETELDTEFAIGKSGQREIGFRTVLATPLLREGTPLGAILIRRMEVSPFADNQVKLLEVFATQAVIAIENVRLFNETKEALERQTVTSEILRVISSSPTDIQPVFEAIVASASRLCDAAYSAVARFEDGLLHLVAVSNMSREETAAYHSLFPRSPGRHFVMGRAFVEGRPVHIEDIDADPEYEPRTRQVLQSAAPYRTVLGIPILRDGVPIGAIGSGRREVKPFTAAQIELVKTFADQAVIAIENVRLFTELRARTAELTRSVEQLTALGEVGRAVSATLDLDTVLDTIVTRAKQLAGTDGCTIYEYDEASEAFRLRASRFAHPHEAAVLDPIARATPIPKGQGLAGRAALLREPVHIPDIAVEGAYESPVRAPLLQAGYRALLGVPLLREQQVVGVLAVIRKTPGDFGPEVVRVLMTFATQSALAIENARLFREIADKSRQLEAASHHKSAFLANMSHELRTPLNAILGFSEVLAERMFGEVNAKQAEYLQDILSSGRHLLSLINDILDLSKVEAGRLELELGRFHLPTALDNVLTLVRGRAMRHGITLTQAVDERLGDIVADERKVKQILVNLLSNAVKYTPEGGRVGLSATAAEGALTIAVSDTGVGIATEDQAAIFEEFRQAGLDDARRQEGTGLGLTLAKKFVELHGGRIWLQSQVGQGATFSFTLPVRLDDRSASDQGGGEPPRP